MNNFLTDQYGPYEPASVDDQLKRIQTALGSDWMIKMDVAPETVRTWKKRKAIPISQLANAAKLAGRPIEWFTMNRYVTEKGVPSFFLNQEKQIIHLDDHILDALQASSKIDPGESGKNAMQKLQASTETIKRVSAELNYEPPMIWTALLQELMFSHGLTEAGVHRIMESLKLEKKG